MYYGEIIAGTVGKENAYGTIYGLIKALPFTYLRLTTDDRAGKIKGYAGEGEVTRDKLETFGGCGVIRVPSLQGLLQYICENGFEHHVVMNLSRTADMVCEALAKYQGWPMYQHT
jgi:L-fucose isomerase-like protein